MIGILGIVVIIVATVMAYKTARDYERNAAVWAMIVFAVGFSIQFLLPFSVGMAIAVFMAVKGNLDQDIRSSIEMPLLIFGIFCIIFSVVVMLWILRHLSKVPEDKSFTHPPKPPNFN